MSYCRWSTNSFRCDVYVYAAQDNWVIHVAGNKLVFPEDLPDEPSLEDIDGWLEHFRLVQQLIDKVQRVPLNLGHDGETFELGSPGECADTLAMLADCGYRVPVGVIAELRQEQSESVD